MWKDLIICGVTPGSGPNSVYEIPCQWGHLGTLFGNLMHNLVVLTTFLAVIAFIYAGFLLLTSMGNSSKKDKAKKVFSMVLFGYLWILAAWLIVYTISDVLLKPGYSLLGSPN
jgi:hypothetical protein